MFTDQIGKAGPNPSSHPFFELLNPFNMANRWIENMFCSTPVKKNLTLLLGPENYRHSDRTPHH